MATEWNVPNVEDTEPTSRIQSEEEDLAPGAGEFPIDALNPVMRQIAEETAETYEVDLAVPAMATIATVAGCPGKWVTLIGAASGRVTPTNLYVLCAAPKSYGKNGSATVLTPFVDASRELTEHFCTCERPKLRAERRIKEARAKQLVKEIAKGENEKKTAARRFELQTIEARLAEIERLDARLPSLTAGNATTAALYEILRRNDETILSYVLEAGDLIRIVLGKYNLNKAADFDLYLSGYTVEPIRQSRVSREDSGDIVPCISALWFCQPFLMRELYANEEVLERGLTARVLPFMVERDEIPEEDEEERFVSAEARTAWENLVRNALTLRNCSYQIECSADARAVFRAFHNEAIRLRNGKYREIEGELGRWRENAARVANGQFIADMLMNGQIPQDERLILSGEQAERGIPIARWSHLKSLAMLNMGLADRHWTRVEKLKELLYRYNGQVSLRHLRRNHGFLPEEVPSLAHKFPATLQVISVKPDDAAAGGRPSEVLKFTDRASVG